MTTDDRLVSGASSEPSLPPNKSSGDIVDRLRERQTHFYDGGKSAISYDPEPIKLEAAAEIERLGRESVDKSNAWDEISKKNTEIAKLKSALAGAMERAAEIADQYAKDAWGCPEEQSAAESIASAIRAASSDKTGSTKTAESGNSPSTPPSVLSDPKCGCVRCLDAEWIARPDGFVRPSRQRMVLCQVCGNKRCPHATDHTLACTNSNEPGQAGSQYA